MDEKNLALQVLCSCRNELSCRYPMLNGAFACLPTEMAPELPSWGTDGEKLYVNPRRVVRSFGEDPNRLRRGVLHVLLHLLYLHPYTRGHRDRALWDLACDIAAEQIIESLGDHRLTLEETEDRRRWLSGTPQSAQQIYGRLLETGERPEGFRFDDHSLWEKADPEGIRLWQQAGAYGAGRGSGHRGTAAGEESEALADIRRGIGDYRTYLKQFCRPQEELELDLDGFDPIYYRVGMDLYGNIPLMEPPETREGYKLRQLVIAIDTSGSCDRETVRRFLEETYAILSDRENFFRKMEVWLIQCDCLIQSVAVIRSREQWKNYARSITVEGRGGTDFTPVFQYVDQQRSLGRLRDLGALLYFTDGDGCYPRVKPNYETAFVFVERTEFMDQVPSWARKLLAEKEGKQ